MKRRTLRTKGKVKIGPDMNVTPLVDVVLVLLIIFMVLAPLTTSSFGVRIPPKPDEKDQALAAVNDPDAVLVLKVESGEKVLINRVEVPTNELSNRLERMLNARKDRVLYMDGGNDVDYGVVLRVMDVARAGGASPVVLMTKEM
jgi:biopolymer transport protein ExbD